MQKLMTAGQQLPGKPAVASGDWKLVPGAKKKKNAAKAAAKAAAN